MRQYPFTQAPPTRPSPAIDIKDFRERLCSVMAVEIRFIAEEFGTDALAIEDFRDDFSERFPEFSEWRKKYKKKAGIADPRGFPGNVSTGTDRS